MADHERSLAEPVFPDDDGQVHPALGSAFGDHVQVLSVLGGVRVFVPIVAVLGERATDGSDKSADMAAVLLTGADGRQALLAFSSVEAMAAWNPNARPVPLWGREAAQAALDEGAAALLLDLANTTFTVVETADLQHLAAGHQIVTTEAGTAWYAQTPDA